jgi:hypothetical protein
MIGSDRGVTVGRGRIRLRSSHRSSRISLQISHRRLGLQQAPMFGRRDDQEDVQVRKKPHGNRGKKNRRG